MLIDRYPVGPLLTNCYLVRDAKNEAVLIDPGFHPEFLLEKIREKGAAVRAVLCTHGHYDHTFAARAVCEQTGAELWMSRADQPLWERGGAIDRYVFEPKASELIRAAYRRPDHLFSDGEEIRVGELCFRVVAAPGHTPGSVLLLTESAVFTGDTLMRGAVGRTDFPESLPEKMPATLRMVASLADSLAVCPGHGDPTDMAREKRFNPFLRESL